MKVGNIICKSIYDSIIDGDPLKHAQSSGTVEVPAIVPLLWLAIAFRIPSFRFLSGM